MNDMKHTKDMKNGDMDSRGDIKGKGGMKDMSGREGMEIMNKMKGMAEMSAKEMKAMHEGDMSSEELYKLCEEMKSRHGNKDQMEK